MSMSFKTPDFDPCPYMPTFVTLCHIKSDLIFKNFEIFRIKSSGSLIREQLSNLVIFSEIKIDGDYKKAFDVKAK